MFGGRGLADLMGGMAGPAAREFNTQLRAYSVVMSASLNQSRVQAVDKGGKILLPPSALDWLTRLHIEYPMQFKLTNINPSSTKVTHCGVLEFLAEEGKAYLPAWMMRQLLLSEGDIIQVEYTKLPKATYAKLKPLSTDFLNTANPKVLLEVCLREFACLTKGDIFPVMYINKNLEFEVKDLKPANAASIVECDMNVDFDTPEGYVEPQAPTPKIVDEIHHNQDEMEKAAVRAAAFLPFSGAGQRLDQKNLTEKQTNLAASPISEINMRLLPNKKYKPGRLHFLTQYKRVDTELKEKEQADSAGPQNGPGGSRQPFQAFSGAGHTLRG